MRTFVYVDGFNLYYGALKGTQYKWLDLKTLLTRVLQPHHEILKIKYFTASVSGTPQDPRAPIRQRTYFRALQHYIPEIEIHYGHFLSHEVHAPLANPGPEQPRFVQVIKTEEKGSDVNLAVHMLNDAWLDSYDCAVVVSNDSDLAESMRPCESTPKQTHRIDNAQHFEQHSPIKAASTTFRLRAPHQKKSTSWIPVALANSRHFAA